MHRIDTNSADIGKFGTGKNGYENATPGIEPATECSAAAFDAMQEEILSPIEATSITPIKATNTQLLESMCTILGQAASKSWPHLSAGGKDIQINGVCCGNGVWVAVGEADGADGYILSSPDGVTWTEHANTHNIDLRAVAFGNGLFVAVGAADTVSGGHAYILTSTDGAAWTERSGGAKQYGLNAVAYGDNVWCAVGDNDTGDAYIVTSDSTGVTWTERAAGTIATLILKTVYFNGGVWSAGGYEAATSKGYFLKSTNGTTWADGDSFAACTIRSIAFGNGKYVAVGFDSSVGGTVVFNSTDAITWVKQTYTSTNYIYSITCSHNVWVGVGSGLLLRSAIFYSLDGSTWYEAPIVDHTASRTLICMAYYQGCFVAVGEHDCIRTSLRFPVMQPNWVTLTSIEPAIGGSITYGNGVWVQAGYNDGVDPLVLYSYDGLAWNQATRPAKVCNLTSVAFGNGHFVAVGQVDTIISKPLIYTSTDGITWAQSSAGVPADWSELYGVGYGLVSGTTPTFVAVGKKYAAPNKTYIITSTDNGVTWTVRVSPNVDKFFWSVGFGPIGFVVSGETSGGSPYMWYSPTGVTWTQITDVPVGANGVSKVRYANGVWVACGDSSVTDAFILSSYDGLKWTRRVGGSEAINATGLIYGHGEWIVSGYVKANGYPLVLRSRDGITWEHINFPSKGLAASPVYYDGAGTYLFGYASPGNVRSFARWKKTVI